MASSQELAIAEGIARVEAGKSNANLNELVELLGAAAADVGVSLAAAQLTQLATHFRLLLQWNQKINLSGVRNKREIAARHFGESLFLSTLLPATGGLVMDIGSGAGFPGLPLKAVWPAAEILLVESNLKKSMFLQEVIRQGRLSGIRVLAERLERVVQGAWAGKVDRVTMRAVLPSSEVLASLKKLLAPAGQLALYLGTADAERLADSENAATASVHSIANADRRAILILQYEPIVR